MKILSMTATFGKLANQTLTLQSGMNVINAPNEWGKSTWCAFMIAMLYGVDTKERTTKDFLAVKERYKPWSGSEMSGRMEILWDDRKITIERSSKGRTPMGQFRAYETDTGLEIPQLTADNCGEVLLGVEKNVFTHAGFILLNDLPVKQDEALRRRLNALVTTGDESGAGDALMQKLKDLKNRCRHNRTGEIPKAEVLRDHLETKLTQLQDLQTQFGRIAQRQEEVKGQIALLENHLTALEFESAKETANRVAQAEKSCEDARGILTELEAVCNSLPTATQTQENLRQLEQLTAQRSALYQEAPPEAVSAPDAPAIFADLSPEEACHRAKVDKEAYDKLCKPANPLLLILSAVLALSGIALLFVSLPIAIPLLVVGVVLLPLYFRNKSLRQQEKQALADKYLGVDSTLWVAQAVQYQLDTQSYIQKSQVQVALNEKLSRRKQDLDAQLITLLGNRSLEEATAQFSNILAKHQELSQAQQTYHQAQNRAQELKSLVRPVAPPAFADNLTLTQTQTQQALTGALAEAQQLQKNLGLCQGQMESLGQGDALRRELAQVNHRISQLETYEQAVMLAISTLEKATQALQRRFAPQISGRAQELLTQLTGGRYNRLQLTQELTLQASTADEPTLFDAQVRSAGTIDQLYLALRLAVAEALTPKAPLVLDDALVRFDDTRLALAMQILQKEAEEKQVIVFTCQGREEKLQ